KANSKSKKPARDSDSDGDIGNKKKRRRIKDTMFESSSEDEIVLDESPEPSPVKPKTLVPESPDSGDDLMEVSQPEDKHEHSHTPGRRRKRRRKLVPKTFKDEDGFIVTEKVWESESTDASEIEEPAKPPPSKQPSPNKKTEVLSTNKSPSAKQKPQPAKSKKKASPAKGSKQTSMMSFFKKK
ncbi:hypothetical protein ScPMuIL_002908, partial [Solemya velum]